MRVCDKEVDMSIRMKTALLLLVFFTVTLVNTFIVMKVVANNKRLAKAINIAGRQRMLTQRMTKEALFYTAGRNDYKDKFISTMDLFETSLNNLIEGKDGMPAPPENIYNQLIKVKSMWDEFKKHANNVINDPNSKEDMYYLEANNIPLLTEMNKAVKMYEKAADVSYMIGVQAVIFIITLLALIGSFVFMHIGIIKPLEDVQTVMRGTSEELTENAKAISDTSQTLAENAMSQASSLEETASAVEEITSQIENNADNAKEAQALSQEALEATNVSQESMEEMVEAINEINSSSENISKIIKTIEEIAFQTNLLALNAAVEAARAGEAGKGFAVVAEEVRNLAQRSAQAAKETTAIIEENLELSRRGVDITNRTKESLEKVINNTRKIADLIGEISAASSEQAQGIQQINDAIATLDKSTQETAATAEETASVATEMSEGAERLNELIKTLHKIVYGKNTQNDISINSDVSNKEITYKDKSDFLNDSIKTSVNAVLTNTNPEDILPLEDDEF